MRDPICDFNSHSNPGLSGWFNSRQEFNRVYMVKEFYKQPVCSKSDQWFREPVQILGNYRNGIPLVGLWHFFYPYVKKDFYKPAATILKLIGAALILFNFLIATPLHDIMVTTTSTLFLTGLFYITVFILKTKLQVFKVSCIVCFLIFYFTLYLYGSGDWGLLAIMQKVTFICSMLLVLGIEYFTKLEDFNQMNPNNQKLQKMNL